MQLETIEARNEIMQLESHIKAHPAAMVGDCFPLKHSFAEGIYVREIAIPKDMIVVSKIHKFSHPVFILKGDISVYTDEGVKRLKGPCSFISPAGAKRVGLTHEDTVWITVHATPETDLERIEDEIIAKNFEQLDEEGIMRFINERSKMGEVPCHS